MKIQEGQPFLLVPFSRRGEAGSRLEILHVSICRESLASRWGLSMCIYARNVRGIALSIAKSTAFLNCCDLFYCVVRENRKQSFVLCELAS